MSFSTFSFSILINSLDIKDKSIKMCMPSTCDKCRKSPEFICICRSQLAADGGSWPILAAAINYAHINGDQLIYLVKQERASMK